VKASPHIRGLLSSFIPIADLEQYDLDALNGRNKDLPKFRHHDSVIALCRHFCPVHRKRLTDKALTVAINENGEEIWIVGGEEMPTSAMLKLAEEYTDKPGRYHALA
jgi:hypothetical protein